MKSRNLLILLLLVLASGGIMWWLMNSPFVTAQNSVEASEADTLWYKNSIIYNLDVEVFKDSDDDGIGDFQGLINRLGYIDSLGVDAIWLAPFQPTPNGDDGYDVMDYYAVDERLGSMEDFSELMEEAEKKDIRVLMDLVINHSSDQHPWFQQARQDEDSFYRDWYYWSEERPQNYDKGMVFPGEQESIWTYDSVAGEYYYHRFYEFQPDLNNHYEPVQEEVEKIIKFWLDRGIAGFRLDAVPFILEIPEKEGMEFEHDYELLKEIREHVESVNEDAVLLGEANVKPEANENYLAEGEGLHMMFNFFVNQHLFYALASGETDPLKEAMKRTREIPDPVEWGQFLRNHDEVDLDRLTEEQRQKVYEEFGPKEHMQIYDRGIRRRLAPMLDNDRKHLELAYSLLFALPSSPVLRYGDEIGMGDDLSLEERLAVRTPMQWDDSRNAGFTENRTAVRPVIDFGEFSYENAINVEDQKTDTTSLLQWTVEMIDLRKRSPEISYGDWEIFSVDHEEVLTFLYEWKDRKLLLIHNMSPENRQISIERDMLDSNRLFDRRASTGVLPENGKFSFDLEGYDYRWLKVE